MVNNRLVKARWLKCVNCCIERVYIHDQLLVRMPMINSSFCLHTPDDVWANTSFQQLKKAMGYCWTQQRDFVWDFVLALPQTPNSPGILHKSYPVPTTFAALQKALKDNKYMCQLHPWVSLPTKEFTEPDADLLFIREEYRALEEEIDHQAITNMVVTGNPGIGKSMFALYMLIRHVLSPLFFTAWHWSALQWCQPSLSSYTLTPCFVGLLFCRKVKTNTVLWQAGLDVPYFRLFHDGTVRKIDAACAQVSSTTTLSCHSLQYRMMSLLILPKQF